MPFPVLLLIMMGARVLLLILLSGLLVHFPKRCRLVHAVRDRAFLPGPLGIWESGWVDVPASAICAEDVDHWPFFYWPSG